MNELRRMIVVSALGVALVLGAVAGSVAARGNDDAEGAAVDAEVLRWQREKRFFETETSRIRSEIDALKKQRPRGSSAQRRHHHKWIQLTGSYFEVMASHYGAHGRYLEYALDQYHDGVGALGEAIEQTDKSNEELRTGMAEVERQKQRAMRFALLADEINSVLHEPVANIAAYEQMLEIADQNLAGFEEILAGLGHSSRQWRMDKVTLEAEIGRIEVAREMASTLETLYERTSSAYRGIAAIDSVDVLDDLDIKGLLESVESSAVGLRPELPPTLGILPERASGAARFDWGQRVEEYQGAEAQIR